MVVRTYVARVGHFPGLDTLSVDQHVKKKTDLLDVCIHQCCYHGTLHYY